MADQPRPRLVVMVSGGGSNLQALIDAVDAGTLHAQIVRVVSNRAKAYALTRAAAAEIPTYVATLKDYKAAGKPREQYDTDLAEVVAADMPDLIVLAGWMHILSEAFLDRFPGKVINLHPALPGQFAGTHAIERAFDAYQRGEIKTSGCMVHHVIPEVDAGPVVATVPVPMLPEDTLTTFEERMHVAEHRLIVEAVRLVLSDGA